VLHLFAHPRLQKGKYNVVGRHRSKSLALIFLAVFLSSCSFLPPPLPSCPTDDIYAYLGCVSLDDTGGDFEGIAAIGNGLNAYCEEATSEWLPNLDANAKETTRKIQKEIIRLGEEWDSTDTKHLFGGVVAIYVIRPALLGNFGRTANCTLYFEELKTGEFSDKFEEYLNRSE